MKHQVKKYILIALGLLCVTLAFLGILLPLLPTTPFLLLALYLFARSSTRLRHWLLHHRIFGKYIYDYTVHNAITKRTKIVAITTIWGTMIFSMVVSGKPLVIVILTFIGASVSIYLLRMKTLKE